MAGAERLAVWMHGRRVATLSQARGRLTLAYSSEALAAYDLNTPLLSVSLPLLPRAFGHGQARPFFDGLLPEGEARRMLAYDFRLQEDDTFGLLRVLGRDCAGALVILAAGEPLPEPAVAPPTPMTGDEVAARLRRLATEPLGVDQRVRISLAGVQHKLVLTRLPSGEWALPVGGLPSTHILKKADPRFAHMVPNEAFCLAIGRHLGMRVAEAEVLALPEPILVVTRYDREVRADGTIRRIHQEDLTQALGLGAGAKYEEHGGPGLRRVARLLRAEAPGAAGQEGLLEATLLNMVVGNADAHAKNLSLLHPAPGVIRLAPIYDVMSTAYYPRADVRPGMSVGGKASINEVTARDVVAEAASWGLPAARVRDRVGELLDRFPEALAAAAREVPTAPADLVAFVAARAKAFAEGLVDGAGA